MIPKRVALENFLSFGTPRTEIVFTDDEPLWVLGGANGVGKSAVFDAMTFALFGQHRGGAQEHDLLVRHGADGFTVIFEFECGGTDYRITRNRTASRSPTQSVEKKGSESGKWERVPNVNGVNEVRGWSERTLGLGFDAFSASVLLRQGHADEIITATGTKRLDMLKKIIDAARFETLSKKVHEATRVKTVKLDELKTKRQNSTPVSEAQQVEARTNVETAASQKTAAQAEVACAIGRVGHAKRWTELEPKQAHLNGLIQGAAARAAEADSIRRDKTRLDELAVTLPVLQQCVAARDRIAIAEASLKVEREAHVRHQGEERRLTDEVAASRGNAAAHRTAADEHEREAKQLRDAVERDRRFLTAADGLANLRQELSGFAHDLDEQLAMACERVRVSSAEVTERGDAKAATAGLLKAARDQQQKFATVGVGVTCSLCGQPVTEDHAEMERKRLADQVADLDKQGQAADLAKREADREKTEAEAGHARLDGQVRNRDAKAKQLSDQQATLFGLGITADATELRVLLTQNEANASQHEIDARNAIKQCQEATAAEWKAEAGRAVAFSACEKATQEISECERTRAGDRGQWTTLFGQLSPEWQSRIGSLDSSQLASLETERDQLTRLGIAEQFKQLTEDATRREEWVNQLAEVHGQIDAIPESDRVLPAVAEATERAALEAATNAEQAWVNAREAANDLAQKAEAHCKLVAEIADAEQVQCVHRKLDLMLGKDGLQRELVRTAEREIVRLANDTVQNLSSGDLSIELDDSASGGDEAFALRVRRADDPIPIGVHYLSGSQKFRVAVAVALAIGRFAAGQARPLECVIIDEGFGSLDRDGLQAARDELHRLSRFLRRIILVSHQEEFAREFPVVIQLSRGETGTIATAVRRS